MRPLIILPLFLFFGVTAFAIADEVWIPVVGLKELNMKEVAAHPYKRGVIYTSSEKALYKTENNGKTWKQVFLVKGNSNIINFIGISKQDLFVCTQEGVFKSHGGNNNWKRVFKGVGIEENNALHIAFSKNGNIYLGTEGGLFTSRDNALTWVKDSGGPGNTSIKWISFLKEDAFLAAEKGVYKSLDSGWRRVFVTPMEEIEYDTDITDEAVSAIKPVNSILASGNMLFLATDNGIFVSKDEGNNWDRFIMDGLLTRKIRRILFKDNLYAVTDKGVFVFSDKDKSWEALYKGMPTDKTRDVSVDKEGILWVATDRGLYRTIMDGARLIAEMGARGEYGKTSILEDFEHEPGIKDVQNAAIKYAEVHPDKIKEWRDAAKKKALLPSVSVGLDRYVTDYYHWDAGQNPDILLKGDDVISWDVKMTWDFGELIWNDDQTSIDTRSRLMVQLRSDILDEITRIYFERRRLQVETHLSPPADLRERLERELRIQELTADLDAMTGGYFSSQENTP